MQLDFEALGEADLHIAGLRLWVHGRASPDASDFWDGNWLRVTACCTYPDALVRTRGSIVHLGEVFGLLRGCEELQQTLQGTAGLHCVEPNLRVDLKIKWNGSIDVHIEITPDHMTERHSFDDTLDQSHLPAIILQCNSIIADYPIRQPESLPGAIDSD